MSLSSPTSARPVARIRFSPFSVSGSSVVPVCRPLSDQSVSPCRMMKVRGVVIVRIQNMAGFGMEMKGGRGDRMKSKLEGFGGISEDD